MNTVLIAGPRAYHDYVYFSLKTKKILGRISPSEITIIEGGAAGTDTLAYFFAMEQGLVVNTVEADWDRLGKKAGDGEECRDG